MASTIPELLDAIVDKLEAEDFSPLTVQSERSFAPKRSVKDMGETIYATVTPFSVGLTRASRSLEERRIVVHVGVQKRLEDAKDDDEVDGLINLAQKIHSIFRSAILTGTEDMHWVAGDTPTFFSSEHYDEFTVFTAVVALTYSQTV